MQSKKIWLAVILAATTMLSAVGLVSTGGWLISSAALMPPLLTLQVAIVSVRFFGIARGVSRYADRVVSHDVALSGATQRRVALWKAAAALGPRGMWRLRSSDALDRLTSDNEILQDDITRVKTPFFAATLAAALLVLLQFSLLPMAGVLLAAAFVISGVLVPFLTVRVEQQVALDALVVRNDLTSRLIEIAEHSDELRILGAETEVIRAISDLDVRRVEIEARGARWAGYAAALNGVSSAIAVFGGAALAISAAYVGQLDGPLIAVIALLPWASAEIVATFSTATTARTRVVLAQARIDDLMQRADSRAAERDVVEIASSRESLSVKDLGVTWTDREVVSNVNFEVQRGRISVLTGQSGSGKSSIAAAVLGLVEHAGEIRIDATVLPPLTERCAHITAMLQTTHVFTTSVRENIRVARPDVTDEEIVNALTAAGLEQWFATLDKGLDTVIGAAARGMSGGEIQRLGLARILVTQAPFVVLDEPTEHLDELTSRSVWSAIRQALSDRGVLLITHDRTLLDESMNIVEVPRG